MPYKKRLQIVNARVTFSYICPLSDVSVTYVKNFLYMVPETVCYVTELNDTIRNVITRSETRSNLMFVVIFTQF